MMSGGHGLHEGGGGDLGAGEFAGGAAIAEDEDARAVAHDFVEFGRDEEDGEAVGAELGDELFDLGFGANVDAAGGFVEDDDGGLGGEPAGEEDLLLVAAGEIANGDLGIRGFDAEGADVVVAEFILFGAREGAGGAAFGLEGEDEVFANGEVREDALVFSVFGGEGEAVADGVAGGGDARGCIRNLDLAGGMAVDAEEEAGEFGAAGAEKAGEAEDFAAVEREVDGVKGGGAGEGSRR